MSATGFIRQFELDDMMRKPVSILLLLVCFAFALCAEVNADEPPSWTSFEICSSNNLYCANVTSPDKTKSSPGRRNYVLTVNDSIGRTIWTAPYNFDGYSGGLLTDDGETFVYVNFWYYSDHPVVRIYRKDHGAYLMGADFNIPKAELVQTVSHQIWLTTAGEMYEFKDTNTLLIRTIDGKSHHIDLITGTLKN